jgi:hypothetical protein
VTNVVKNNNALFDLALFILTSARTTIDEPKRYGPRRLLDSFEKLVNLPLETKTIHDYPLFSRLREKLNRHPHLRSSSTVFSQEFKDFLDGMIADFIDEMTCQSQS